MTVLPANMLPMHIHAVGKTIGLPQLVDAEIALLIADTLSKASTLLADHITLSLEGGMASIPTS